MIREPSTKTTVSFKNSRENINVHPYKGNVGIMFLVALKKKLAKGYPGYQSLHLQRGGNTKGVTYTVFTLTDGIRTNDLNPSREGGGGGCCPRFVGYIYIYVYDMVWYDMV